MRLPAGPGQDPAAEPEGRTERRENVQIDVSRNIIKGRHCVLYCLQKNIKSKIDRQSNPVILKLNVDTDKPSNQFYNGNLHIVQR